MKHLRFARTGGARAGLAIAGFVCGVAVFGPLVSPHGPSDLVGAPGMAPSRAYLLGTDYLGHDVLSRVLWGGRTAIAFAVAATIVAFVSGTTIGMVAGYSRGIVDSLLMRFVDVILSFPPLLFFLIVVTSVGNTVEVLVIGVGLIQAPGIARIVYSATREVSVTGYVESAVARGETTRAILAHELFPNVTPTLIANFGLTLTYSMLLTAAITFLGLGLQPPAANWARMVFENRSIVTLNVWSTVAPAGFIASFTIGVNLIGDAIARSFGQSGVDLQTVRAGGVQLQSPVDEGA
jgi:peptide/nickel transport system permease protein